MSDYTKTTNFAAKDALTTGDANKIVKGTEINDELIAIQTAIATKANLISPTFTGTPLAPTAASGTNTTQIATTAFATALLSDLTSLTSDISTTGYVEAGRGSGAIAMVANDGYGNANLTFNHRSATPEQDGNSGRIQCNVDATSNAKITLGVLSNVTNGVQADVTDILVVDETGIDVTGAIVASDDITAFSDERLKENWKSLPNSFIAELANVKSGTYSRIDINGKVQAGVSAQSLQKVLPEAVVETETAFAVNYGNAALVAAVELAKKVVELEDRIKALEAK